MPYRIENTKLVALYDWVYISVVLMTLRVCFSTGDRTTSYRMALQLAHKKDEKSKNRNAKEQEEQMALCLLL